MVKQHLKDLKLSYYDELIHDAKRDGNNPVMIFLMKHRDSYLRGVDPDSVTHVNLTK